MVADVSEFDIDSLEFVAPNSVLLIISLHSIYTVPSSRVVNGGFWKFWMFLGSVQTTISFAG